MTPSQLSKRLADAEARIAVLERQVNELLSKQNNLTHPFIPHSTTPYKADEFPYPRITLMGSEWNKAAPGVTTVAYNATLETTRD